MKVLFNGAKGRKMRRFTVICKHCNSMLEGNENEFRCIGYGDRYLFTCPVCNMQRLANEDELVEVLDVSTIPETAMKKAKEVGKEIKKMVSKATAVSGSKAGRRSYAGVK